MELEKSISTKIRLEELKPIRWEKERVWTLIQRDKKSQGYISWFIAASIALVCSLTVYSIQSNLDQNMLNRITALEFSIDQYRENPKTAEQSLVTLEKCDNTIILPRRSVKGLENVLNSDPSITLIVRHDSLTTASPETSMADSKQVAGLVAEELLTEDAPRIEAIIGVIPSEHKPVRIAKEKRIRVKFSREHEDFLSGDDPKKHVLTARIN